MDATTTVLWVGLTQIYVYQIPLNAFGTHTKKLLKTNDSKGGTYGLNRMSAWLKLDLISVMPILMINLSHVGWPPALWYSIQFFAWLCLAKFLAKIMLTIIIRCLIISWMAIFHLVVNEHEFSVPFECHTLLKSHDIILHGLFHWHHKCHY